MDAELKQRWTAALRSGEYPQGLGALRSSNGYCCLGVLAAIEDELVDPPEVYLAFCSDKDTKVVRDSTGDTTSGYLTAEHTAKWGLDVTLDDPRSGQLLPAMYVLTNLNDSHGYDFHQIADFIEANL